MATRGTIAIQNEDGSVTGIYTHWDSYLSNNGRILQENYTDEDKVRELIALGDLSSLGETVGAKVDFNDYAAHEGQCVAYGRDRGDTGVGAKTHHNWTAFLTMLGQKYDYLFVPGKGWFVSEEMIPLEEALREDQEA